MNSLRILGVLFVVIGLAIVPAVAEELKLRLLKPIITQLTESKNPDISELGYVAARGAALFTALAGHIDANAANERDKKIAEDLQKRAVPYWQVAMACGLMTKKSTENSNEQVKLLFNTYTAMIRRSKQLNNEILSPAILEDMEALKSIESLVADFADTVEKSAGAKKKP